jgi:CheY-like chemotaxis protein
MKARVSVLLIDDEMVTAQLYAKALEKRGVDVIIAATGDEGLEYAKAYNPKLIISDIDMPMMNGFEFCQELKKSDLKRCPVVFFTGHDDISVLNNGLKAGGDDFIIKGGKAEAFLRRSHFWLTSGFLTLPDEARLKAISMLEKEMAGQGDPIAAGVRIDKELLEKIAQQVSDEVGKVGTNYGARLIERVFFMGRLSHLVLNACNTVGSVVRFPDYFIGAARQVRQPWIEDLREVLSNYERFSNDARFKEAAINGLIEIH